MGPTGSGKTEVAEAIAERLGAQLINADAFQVYVGMDIGTAKPKDKHRYRLLDLNPPSEGFGVGEFVQRATRELVELYEAGRSAVVVGGTGLYIRALFESYSGLAAMPEPELRARLMERERVEGPKALVEELTRRAPEVAEKTDLANPVRVRRALEKLDTKGPMIQASLPPFARTKLVLQRDRSELNAHLEIRMHRMVQNGWLEEVEGLRKAGFGPGDPGFRALGYSALWQHLAGAMALNDALDATVTDTRRYAKRQRSWLRSEPGAVPISGTTGPEMVDAALRALQL
ncbi:MAG TPA: tRNA (adenosine(37)-N6)-dimethylallyltransferase MiaA [Fimbriimonadaceae bacterium]|nr:tRNA (adenosine(37)-N6)-dimethylallyltransferase MiaA [Fimbriimonadaceae bacterium]